MNKVFTIWNSFWARLCRHKDKATVKFMFPMLFVTLAVLGAAAISGVSASYVRLEPNKDLLEAGENFSIVVYAYAHVPVNALDVSISFDPSTIEVSAVDKAQSVITIWTAEPSVEDGIIKLSGGTYRRGFVGEHVIATIKAKALKAGQTEFLLTDGTLLAGDGRGTPVAMQDKKVGEPRTIIVYNQGDDPDTIKAQVQVSVSADIDNDGTVTLKDVSMFMSAWFQGKRQYDFNEDGKMNFVDFSIILARSFFGSTN